MTHSVLIAIHAASATLALVLGLVAISRGRLFLGYLASLAAMELSLLGAVAVGWHQNPAAANIVFSGLLVLGAVMCWRAATAWRLLSHGAYPSPASVGHVGFTLISLVDAFVVVSVLRAGAPVWVVVAAGVVIGVAGHLALTAASVRLTGILETPVPGTAAVSRPPSPVASRGHSLHQPSGTPGERTVMPSDSAPRAWTRS